MTKSLDKRTLKHGRAFWILGTAHSMFRKVADTIILSVFLVVTCTLHLIYGALVWAVRRALSSTVTRSSRKLADSIYEVTSYLSRIFESPFACKRSVNPAHLYPNRLLRRLLSRNLEVSANRNFAKDSRQETSLRQPIFYTRS